mmetsp:Transcript_127406/g.220914  ORF Transcript_127406/g.220914 Transcript_127406/m.220914 type:complete len:233 (-) Transcript_127406:463-1161(-)
MAISGVSELPLQLLLLTTHRQNCLALDSSQLLDSPQLIVLFHIDAQSFLECCLSFLQLLHEQLGSCHLLLVPPVLRAKLCQPIVLCSQLLLTEQERMPCSFEARPEHGHLPRGTAKFVVLGLGFLLCSKACSARLVELVLQRTYARFAVPFLLFAQSQLLLHSSKAGAYSTGFITQLCSFALACFPLLVTSGHCTGCILCIPLLSFVALVQSLTSVLERLGAFSCTVKLTKH